MTFDEAVWNFERYIRNSQSEGDLDVELIVQYEIFAILPDELNPDLARRLFGQLKVIEKEFEKQKVSYKQKTSSNKRRSLYVLYQYKNKNLKVDNRFCIEIYKSQK